MDGMRLTPRRRLADMILTGTRKKARDGLRIAILVSVAMTVIGLLLERHHACPRWDHDSPGHAWGPTHRFLSEAGVWPLVVLAVIALGQWWAHVGGMALSVVLAVIDLVLAAVVLIAFTITHLLSHVESVGPGAAFLSIGLSAGMLLTLAQVVVEPWVAIAERRVLERSEPVFPGAIVVRSSR